MSDTESVIPLTCNHRSRGAVLYFDPTDRQWICHGCLLKIRKQRIRAIMERRRILLRSANRSEMWMQDSQTIKGEGGLKT